MRIPRLHIDQNLCENTMVTLGRSSSHYLSRVLRTKPGEKVKVFNGVDGEYLGTVLDIQKDSTTLALDCKTSCVPKEALKIHIAIAITKGGRMDYSIQKSVELGVTEISPLYSEFSEVHFKNNDRLDNKYRHWEKIVISACEQSSRISVPKVNKPVTFGEFTGRKFDETCLLLDPSGEKNLFGLNPDNGFCLIIGPEGGFSTSEIAQAEKNFRGVKLGPRILRSETAPIVAISILQALHGDLS